MPRAPHLKDDAIDDGYAQLAAAILRDALLSERQWLYRERGAVHFWCDVAGLEPTLFYQRLKAVG